MPFLAIFTGAPLWVWLILAYLLLIGIAATKTHKVKPYQLFLMPIIFGAIKYQAFLTAPILYTIIPWLTAEIAGFLINNNTKIKIIKTSDEIEIPGTYSTLALFLIFFGIKFYLGFAIPTTPCQELQNWLKNVDIITSFLFSGYMFGKATAYSWKFYKK